MSLASLKQSAHLKVQRFQSPDELNAIGFVEIERQVLLGSYTHNRAITALPGMHLIVEETSPRGLDAMMSAPGCAAIVPMSDQADVVFNARTWESSAIGLLRGRTPFSLREPHPNTFAIIRFSSDMQNRGWDEAEDRLHLRNADGAQLARLQCAIRRVLALSSAPMADLPFATAADMLQRELVDALDGVLASGSTRSAVTGTFERHRKLVSRLDEFVRSHPAIPLYSEHLAMEVGTSARTLQTAVQTVHGVSLHHYLRGMRLWALRAQLTKGLPLTSVSSAAAANGFAHMGELSRLYKSTFGELPSETLLRSKVA